MEIARAAVVCHPPPDRHHIPQRGGGEGLRSGKGIDKLDVFLSHPCRLRLLKHYLRDQYVVGIISATPWKIPFVLSIISVDDVPEFFYTAGGYPAAFTGDVPDMEVTNDGTVVV